MAPNTETDDKAGEWFNDLLSRMRYGQDYSIYPGDSSPLIDNGKQVGISIVRSHVEIFSTGATKLYEMIVLEKEYPIVEYTQEEEDRFEADWHQKYGEEEIVTIRLKCGHTRTWRKGTKRELYGKKEIANCKVCHAPELISSIIDKAETDG